MEGGIYSVVYGVRDLLCGVWMGNLLWCYDGVRRGGNLLSRIRIGMSGYVYFVIYAEHWPGDRRLENINLQSLRAILGL